MMGVILPKWIYNKTTKEAWDVKEATRDMKYMDID